LRNQKVTGVLYFENASFPPALFLRLEVLASLIVAARDPVFEISTPSKNSETLEPTFRSQPSENPETPTGNRDLNLERDFLSLLSKGIGHEIRNPFFIIRLRAEEIMDNSQNPPEVVTFADSVIRNVDRVLQITDVLLKYASQESTSEGKIMLSELLSDVQTTISTASPKGTQSEWKMEVPAHLAVRGHKNRLYQAFSKIVINAIEALDKPNSQISIQARDLPTGNQIEVKIIDNGIGIESQDLSKIFNLFFTTKYSHQGAGLTIAKEIITALGGTIKVESVLNQGITVIIRLPKY
jgi:signal transduction histidine kinase